MCFVVDLAKTLTVRANGETVMEGWKAMYPDGRPYLHTGESLTPGGSLLYGPGLSSVRVGNIQLTHRSVRGQYMSGAGLHVCLSRSDVHRWLEYMEAPRRVNLRQLRVVRVHFRCRDVIAVGLQGVVGRKIKCTSVLELEIRQEDWDASTKEMEAHQA